MGVKAGTTIVVLYILVAVGVSLWFWCDLVQHADPACKIARRPRSNQDYWLPKLERNVARDAEHHANLTGSGWDVLVLWECDVEAGGGIAGRIREFLERR